MDMDVNKHKRPSNTTLRHKLKHRDIATLFLTATAVFASVLESTVVDLELKSRFGQTKGL